MNENGNGETEILVSRLPFFNEYSIIDNGLYRFGGAKVEVED